MSKRWSSMARLGVVMALVGAGASAAYAADPRPVGKPLSDAEDPRRTPAEQQRARRHEAFEQQRAQATRTMRHVPPPRVQDPARAKTHEVRGVVERVRDGQVLLSVALDPALRPLVARGGVREVKSKAAQRDLSLFEGRVARSFRIQGTDWAPYERVAGKEVVLTLQAAPTGGFAATGVRLIR